MDYHAGGKWFIHGPKRRKENQLLSLKLTYRCVCILDVVWWYTQLSNYSMIQYRARAFSEHICCKFVILCLHGMHKFVNIYLLHIPYDKAWFYISKKFEIMFYVYNGMYLIVVSTLNSSESLAILRCLSTTRLQYIMNLLRNNRVCKYQQMWMVFSRTWNINTRHDVNIVIL